MRLHGNVNQNRKKYLFIIERVKRISTYYILEGIDRCHLASKQGVKIYKKKKYIYKTFTHNHPHTHKHKRIQIQENVNLMETEPYNMQQGTYRKG